MSRRSFLGGAAAVIAAGASREAVAAQTLNSGRGPSFFELIRVPDRVAVYSEGATQALEMTRSGSTWQGSEVEVRTEAGPADLQVFVAAQTLPLARMHLRWTFKVNGSQLYMGDAWERSYGDLAWRTMVPERVMPWYFAAHDGSATHGYGVRTGAAAFCFWQVDPAGVSLWLDLSNGGMGVVLGARRLNAATIVSREGLSGEEPLDAVAGLCRLMCANPRLPNGPIYGTNDWYYAYGNNTADGILRDTDLIVSLSPKGGARPFSVIDGGWQGNGTIEEGARGNARFPDMAELAGQISSRGARPGIWIRPIEAPKGTPHSLLLSSARIHSPNASDSEGAFDPTIPDALDAVLAKMKQVVQWKYELVKHDYSTYDLLGQWGFEMGAQPARPGWSFHDRSRTNAEIILDLYKVLRATAEDKTLLLGCNTVGHLGAGIFEANRTGDDTSGKVWERSRRMGVNTLAYRLPQNGTFFTMDADCVGITKQIPWKMNQQWMDLVARSGTALFISPSPDAVGAEQRSAIAQAFSVAAAGHAKCHATDWLRETTPRNWEFRNSSRDYDWCGELGCDPFPV